MSDPVTDLRDAVQRAAAALAGDTPGPAAPPKLERPPQPDFGDYSTNAAMLLAPVLGEPPREIAERLATELARELAGHLDRAEVAGPGFLNLFLTDAWYRDAAASLAASGDDIGATDSGAERLLIEFVSANPTGPLTAAGGRHAAYGDSVARALTATGSVVLREYYVNDTGGQIDRLTESLAAGMRGEPAPEGGYEGDYIEDLAKSLRDEGIGPEQTDLIASRAPELMREGAAATLARYGVEFDTWSSERSLHESGAIERVLEDLGATGHVYESEGATWLRTTTFGDDKDRVLIRSEGEPTYYLADIAYHRDKLERGGGRLLDVLGADHHGYVARLKAGLAALGFDPDRLEFAIIQLVHVVEGGERSQMSKRKGEFVSLDELIDDIGVDATRFFMLQRSHETTVDLDLDLARRTSSENPVYYVQYAHARIASIVRKAGGDRGEGGDATQVPLEPAERALISRICELPAEVREAADRRAPHRLCAYSMAVASDFHAFYRDCKVIGAEGEGVEDARLRLALLAKRAISQTLWILGISAPERM